MKSQYGSWCLLAGAAEGVGKAFAESLAMRGMHIILVDRQAESLHSLGASLEKRYGISTRRLHLDLADEESIHAVLEALEESACRMLIYNAAYSKIRKFQNYSTDEIERFLQVNIRTPFHLVHGLVKRQALNSGQRGGIILMASLAGLWGSQYLAPYGASKACMINLAEALHHELKQQGMDVMACVAGPISTPAYLATNPKHGRLGPLVKTPEQVAHGALEKLGTRALYIPGWRTRFSYFLMARVLSRKRSAGIFNHSIQKMFPDT